MPLENKKPDHRLIPQRLLISRTDAIGDVILTLPLVTLLKRQMPRAHITFLGRSYTKPVLEACSAIDQVLNWDELKSLSREQQVIKFKNQNWDTVLHVFPNKKIAEICCRAEIPFRIGTARRWYHWLTCNKRPNITRRNSDSHESELNISFAVAAGLLDKNEDIQEPCYALKVDEFWPANLNVKKRDLKRKIILHPGSSLSARNWPLSHFKELAIQLEKMGYIVFVTGSANEAQAIRREFQFAKYQSIFDMTDQLNLSELMSFINACDGLVAASTGPLHIAAALDKVAIGIYPPIRPMHPARWRPLGPHAKVLVKESQSNCKRCVHSAKTCACMSEIMPKDVIKIVQTAFGGI